MAGLLRRVGIGEERGYGFDKIVLETEFHQLPPPHIMAYDTHTRVTLYAHRLFSKMSKSEKLQACYLHACVKWVLQEDMTNSSLRERFAIDEKNKSMVSRLLSDACNAGLIRKHEEVTSDKYRKYLPYWA